MHDTAEPIDPYVFCKKPVRFFRTRHIRQRRSLMNQGNYPTIDPTFLSVFYFRRANYGIEGAVLPAARQDAMTTSTIQSAAGAHLPSSSRDTLLNVYFDKRVLLVRYFTRVAGDASAAEDVVQDLYVRLANLQDAPPLDDPTAFLFRMAHNIHRNQLRSLGNGRRRDSAWHDLSREYAGDEVIDDAPSAEDAVAGRQQMAQVNAALDELPEKTQTIFRLHKLEGVAQTEVAGRLGISLSSVEKHLSSALKHLVARVRPPPRAGPGP